jgi:hypothetical protein
MEGVTPYKKMELHAEFDSYKEFELVLEKYQKEHFVQLWKRDARTIKSMQSRAPDKKFNDTLLYGLLKFCCIHGGKDHKSSSLGKHVKSFQSIKCL